MLAVVLACIGLVGTLSTAVLTFVVQRQSNKAKVAADTATAATAASDILYTAYQRHLAYMSGEVVSLRERATKAEDTAQHALRGQYDCQQREATLTARMVELERRLDQTETASQQ